jgi:hypothetical protein
MAEAARPWLLDRYFLRYEEEVRGWKRGAASSTPSLITSQIEPPRLIYPGILVDRQVSYGYINMA